MFVHGRGVCFGIGNLEALLPLSPVDPMERGEITAFPLRTADMPGLPALEHLQRRGRVLAEQRTGGGEIIAFYDARSVGPVLLDLARRRPLAERHVLGVDAT